VWVVDFFRVVVVSDLDVLNSVAVVVRDNIVKVVLEFGINHGVSLNCFTSINFFVEFKLLAGNAFDATILNRLLFKVRPIA
jgi:hypothetical protein